MAEVWIVKVIFANIAEEGFHKKKMDRQFDLGCLQCMFDEGANEIITSWLN